MKLSLKHLLPSPLAWHIYFCCEKLVIWKKSHSRHQKETQIALNIQLLTERYLTLSHPWRNIIGWHVAQLCIKLKVKWKLRSHLSVRQILYDKYVETGAITEQVGGVKMTRLATSLSFAALWMTYKNMDDWKSGGENRRLGKQRRRETDGVWRKG